MKILKVCKSAIAPSATSMMAEYGLVIEHLSPTLHSAITAIMIAKAVDKHDIDIIEVERYEDAMAAISAKQICTNKNVAIVFNVIPNAELPRLWHRDILKKVDGWIFASERLQQKVGVNRNCIVLQPVSLTPTDVSDPNFDNRPITFAMVGILRNTNIIKEALDAIDACAADVTLRICGAGVARDVMPAVMHSRSLPNSHRFFWIGEEYKYEKELNKYHCAIQCDKDMSEIEAHILSTGRPVIRPSEVAQFVKEPRAFEDKDKYSVGNYLTKLREFYLSIKQN